MKKYIFFFLIGVFQVIISFGQNHLIKQWDYRYGGDTTEYFYELLQTSDGGLLLGGSSASGISGDKSQSNQDPLGRTLDFWIVKTDAYGNKQWDKRYGGDREEYFTSVCQTSDGGYLIGGNSNSAISGDKTQPNWDTSCSSPSQCSFDYWIIRIDSTGNKLWDKTYGTIYDENFYVARQTLDGGFILGGYTDGGINGDKTEPSKGYSDFWIVKIDAAGNKQWDKDFGGTEIERMYDLQQTTDGDYILSGDSESDSSGDKTQPLFGGVADFWIVRIDSLGNKLWDKDFGGNDDERPFCMELTNDHGFIFGGISRSGVGGSKTQPCWGGYDYWVIKIDSIGNKQWDKDFGGVNTDVLSSVKQTADNGYILGGDSDSGISGDKSESNLSAYQSWIVKIDSVGNMQWDKTLKTISPYGDYYSSAIQTNDGCYVIANSCRGEAGGDKTQPSWDVAYYLKSDMWVTKFCFSEAWLTSSDTNFCDKKYIDFIDQSTNSPTSWQWLFPGGVPSSSTLQNPVGIYYNSYGIFDVTLIACNASGCDTLFLPNFINEFQSPPVPVVTWIADTLFSTPAFAYQWYFNSNAISGATDQYYVFQQPGGYFVIVTDSNGCSTPSTIIYTGIDELNSKGGIYVIPNPTDGDLILVGPKVNSMVKIYDVAGRVLYSGKIKSLSEKIHFDAVDGIYFIEIAESNNFIKEK